jgi:hypothetical protein
VQVGCRAHTGDTCLAFVYNSGARRHRAGGIWVLAFRWHLCGIWVAFGWHLGGIWVAFGWHLGGIWVAFGWHLGGIWVAFGWHLCGIWVAFGWHVGGIWVACGWHVGGMWVAFGWHLGGMWVAFGWHLGGICLEFRCTPAACSWHVDSIQAGVRCHTGALHLDLTCAAMPRRMCSAVPPAWLLGGVPCCDGLASACLPARTSWRRVGACTSSWDRPSLARPLRRGRCYGLCAPLTCVGAWDAARVVLADATAYTSHRPCELVAGHSGLSKRVQHGSASRALLESAWQLLPSSTNII